MITFPNAKINLGLQVLSKRPDNYHNIETVFYPVPVFDILEIVEAQETKLFLSGIDVPDAGNNLCNRVYQMLQKDFALSPIHIHLHKNIPVGAGLGGGSSDASFLIKLLNDYFDLEMSIEQMKLYATKIGADCAFFITNKPAFAFGIGDNFSAIDVDLSDYHLVLVKSPIHINTASAFENITPRGSGLRLKEHILEPVETWQQNIFNDFEPSVFHKYPQISKIKDGLYNNGAIYASMSGSGSSVFGIFESPVHLPELEKSNQVIYC